MGLSTANMTTFQFITSINTVARDDETRRRVRSHARRQKLPNDSNPPQSKKTSTQKERTSKFRLKQLSAVANNHKRPQATSKAGFGPTREKGKSKFDTSMITQELAISIARELPTFSMLQIETTPLTENLLKYCLTVCLSPRETFVHKWFDRAGAPTYMNTYYPSFLAMGFSMNPQGNLIESVQVDAAATHAFLAMVAAMHNSLAKWGDTSTIDFHRFQAVKSINERLNLEGKNFNTPVSDGVIVAVALLVHIEAYIGSLAASAAHMSGLKRMVDLRGGIIDGFSYSTLLQRAIAWADFSYATAANKPVMLPFIPQLASSLSLHDKFQSRSMIANMERHGYRDLTIHKTEAVEIFELLYAVTSCIDSFDYSKLEEMSEQRVQASDSVYLIEWQLCQLEQQSRDHQSSGRAEPIPLIITPTTDDFGSPIAGSPSTPSTDISDALIYASHLFLHLAIRGQPPAAARHRALTEALMFALCETLLALDLLSDPDFPSPQHLSGTPSSHRSGSSQSSHSESWHTNFPGAGNGTTPSCELHSDMLLWTLFVGSCVQAPARGSGGSNEAESAFALLLGDPHDFFVSALRNCCRMRGITEKGVLQGKLRDIMWLGAWCENQFEMLLAEVGDKIVRGGI
ncbi:hypothetical protein F4778DRAFT_269344 [Xylariomycetidae sp. FL2044]|nr:hypothetical protein F4778DRAFT_269344 [Xylariomycetidae sp. FL2044]